MVKRLLAVLILIGLVVVSACSKVESITDAKGEAEKPDVVKIAKLANQWNMSQMKVKVRADDDAQVLVKLAYGNRLDGFYFLESGDNIEFEISADTAVYKSALPAGESSTAAVTSDRFSVESDGAQGTTYILTFRNPTEKDAVVFLECIYPVTDSLFFPAFKD